MKATEQYVLEELYILVHMVVLSFNFWKKIY